jgi:hypothetical protein
MALLACFESGCGCDVAACLLSGEPQHIRSYTAVSVAAAPDS